MITLSAAYLLIGAAALAGFAAFVGHVVGFGWRTRHAQIHLPAQSSRERRDRAWVGLVERHMEP